MSLDPILWALKDAPVADSLERLVLVALAERAARADGCTAFPSRDTLAAMVLADPKTVQRVLGRLTKRGLIARGDQTAARYLRADRRPVVYDLMIPFSWFPNPGRVNDERAQAGLPPLTPESRPDIVAAPARARRADAGKTRAERGDCEPPRHGGTASPERGDCESPTGGLQDPRTSPRYTPGNHPVLPSGTPACESAAAPRTGGTDGGGVPELAMPSGGLAVLLEVARRQPALALAGRPLRDQAVAVEGRLALGWSPGDLATALAGEPPAGMRSAGAVVAARVRALGATTVAEGAADGVLGGLVPRQTVPAAAVRLAYDPPPSCATCTAFPAPGEDQCPSCLGWPVCASGCGRRTPDGAECEECVRAVLEAALRAPETETGDCPCGRAAVTLGWCSRCRVAAQAAQACHTG